MSFERPRKIQVTEEDIQALKEFLTGVATTIVLTALLLGFVVAISLL